MIAFGPVPSRRLGQSLGINNIPPKICSYSCVYCQLGRSLHMQIEREEFYNSQDLYKEVEQKVRNATTQNEPIDYLAFVPDGEPTLEKNLGRQIKLLKGLGIHIAVITNSSLLWNEQVRKALCLADWVSVKIDAITHDVWRRLDRPYGTLRLEKILQGISEFSQIFSGEFVTETMLVQGVNETPEVLHGIADFVAQLNPNKSYLSIPTRPPAEKWVQPAAEDTLNMAYHFFREKGIDVEYLLGYEGNAFAFTGNVEEDVLSITAVHPMREDAVQAFVTKARANWSVVEKLLREKQLMTMDYNGDTFYMRTLKPVSDKTG